ncbi:MAG: trypsin-like peptidase domain-containing protein [Victivallales bacterium]|nr:trypsin-like peptidase domain-containing protein [Victivallales bacterium]MBQ6473295.1 trypsin-like peptidase domain-containing protein [Victivallales bacterium]
MKKILAFFCLVGLSLVAVAQEYDPLNAVVRVDTIYYQPNFSMPWQNRMQDSCCGSGVVITGNRILTAAHNVTDATYITVMKQSSDENYPATVLAVDHDCDLALLEVEDQSFFNDILPFEIGETPPPQTQVAVAGFPIGGDGLSITQGVISRIETRTYVHSYCNLLCAQLDAAINPGNSGGPVVNNGSVVGIAFQSNNRGEGLGYMVPTEIIRHFLRDIEDGKADGFGSAGFRYATLENPDTRRYLKMTDGQTGVRITYVCQHNRELLQLDDVLLAIDGIHVANNGYIRLVTGESRAFSTLISQRQIGEKIDLTILRDGKELVVQLPVKKIEYLCKDFLYDTLPDYYIVGGFVFTTLSYSFLDEWGNDSPPAELVSKTFTEKTSPDEETVVLSFVLGDRVNVGYQGLMALQLNKVNEKKVINLPDLISFIENSEEEFITLTLGENDYPVTLDLKKLRDSTPAILKRYRVPADRSASLR